MAERLKALVLKTSNGETRSWVRSPSPPEAPISPLYQTFLTKTSINPCFIHHARCGITFVKKCLHCLTRRLSSIPQSLFQLQLRMQPYLDLANRTLLNELHQYFCSLTQIQCSCSSYLCLHFLVFPICMCNIRSPFINKY